MQDEFVNVRGLPVHPDTSDLEDRFYNEAHNAYKFGEWQVIRNNWWLFLFYPLALIAFQIVQYKKRRAARKEAKMAARSAMINLDRTLKHKTDLRNRILEEKEKICQIT